jgi:hypothetical protein
MLLEAMAFKDVIVTAYSFVGVVDDKLSPKHVPLSTPPFPSLNPLLSLSTTTNTGCVVHNHAILFSTQVRGELRCSLSVMSFSQIYLQTYIQLTNHGTSPLLIQTVYITAHIHGSAHHRANEHNLNLNFL